MKQIEYVKNINIMTKEECSGIKYSFKENLIISNSIVEGNCINLTFFPKVVEFLNPNEDNLVLKHQRPPRA